MVIPGVNKYTIPVFWDDEFKNLNYVNESFNDPDSVNQWVNQGYYNRFTGDMCDMRSPQPSWNCKFLKIFSAMGWKDIGTSYYRMNTGTILPVHQDLYVKYIQLYNLKGLEHSIRRAVLFLEDWKSGHYGEYNGVAFVGWRAGDVIEWTYDLPHSAANLGIEPRYTLQITGHV
jgi:hypothetical protein